jgi:shikimate kinase
MSRRITARDLTAIRNGIAERSIVLVGLMGAGKSTVGRRLAERLELPFVDADLEIERAAGKTVPEIFADHGEAYFHDGERRVISRLIDHGPQVLATGGGAFINPEIRKLIGERGISVWLRAELPLLMKRVRRRSNRPLLDTTDPEAVMRRLIDDAIRSTPKPLSPSTAGTCRTMSSSMIFSGADRPFFPSRGCRTCC